MTGTAAITELLRAHEAGVRDALDQVVPLVYDELRSLARRHLRRGPAGYTLDIRTTHRYLATVGAATEVPQRSPGRGPPYWRSRLPDTTLAWRWTGQFKFGSTRNPNGDMVGIFSTLGRYFATFSVALSRYAYLCVAKEGARLRVVGELEDVEYPFFRLRGAWLFSEE